MKKNHIADEFPTFTEIVEFPESQNLVEKEGFCDNCALINSLGGINKYGNGAYRVNPTWLAEVKSGIIKDIEDEYEYNEEADDCLVDYYIR